jgi:large subunit ribosomal protein L1
MMTTRSKRMQVIAKKVDKTKAYTIEDALALVKICASAKFDESVDIVVMLGIDAKKSDQSVRGATVLPHGTGRSVRVAVFAQGAKAQEALAAGADIVGFDDLAESIKAQTDIGKLDFDMLIATPDAMRLVGQLGRVLGPRGLMPNPKVGTVTMDVAQAVKNAKSGQVTYRTDKNGIIHCSIGKAKFDVTDLKDNFLAVIRDLRKIKPSTSKGIYLKKVMLSTTMGPGILVDQGLL